MMPSLGSLLGSRVSTEVFSAINDLGHTSFFGSAYDERNKEFFMRYVMPMDQVNNEIAGTITALMNPDRFRPLTSFDDLRNIPPCMELSIALFAPVRQGIIEGRYEGFGYDPETLPEDFFGRIINNGGCDDVGAAMNADGEYEVSSVTYSDDPELDANERDAIRKTRDYIWNKIMAETDRDPTAIDLPSG
jgi:hypothetical protein